MDEEAIYREFGRRMAVRRKEVDITQQSLSQRVGLSRGSIANIERGKQKLPLHHVYRIAAELQLYSPADLLPPIHAADEHEMDIKFTAFSDDLDPAERAQVTKLYRESGLPT